MLILFFYFFLVFFLLIFSRIGFIRKCGFLRREQLQALFTMIDECECLWKVLKWRRVRVDTRPISWVSWQIKANYLLQFFQSLLTLSARNSIFFIIIMRFPAVLCCYIFFYSFYLLEFFFSLYIREVLWYKEFEAYKLK